MGQHVVLAAFNGGSTNAPRRSRAQLRSQSYLRAFVCSVVANTDAHLYLFVSPLPAFELFAASLGGHPRVHVMRASSASAGTRLQQQRYRSYLDLLRRLAHNASKVVLADASDVVFQHDPFPYVRRGLYTAEESGAYTLGSHPINSMWVSELYGDSTLRSLRGHRVVCSGLTMGTADAVARYLERMVSEGAERLGAARLKELQRKHGRDRCRGLDQGIHNALVRGPLRDGVTVMPSAATSDANEGGAGERGGAAGGAAGGGGGGGAADGAPTALLDGAPPLFHGNEMRCAADVALADVDNASELVYAPSRRRPSARSRPIAVAHQYGRLRGACQRSVRRALTCRPAAAHHPAPPPAGSRLPTYCGACAERWPRWLGDATNSWRASEE